MQTCTGCGKPAESGVTALGGLFHPECFTCQCGTSLLGVNFFPAPDGKKAICAGCNSKNGDKCAKCGEGMDRWTEAMGKKFHPQCFVCGKCGGALSGGFMPSGNDLLCTQCGNSGQPSCSGCSAPLQGAFGVKDGKPLCDACMTKAAPPTGECSVCSKPMQSGIVVMGAQMHAECFACGACGCSMAGKSYSISNGKPVCSDCVAKGGASRGACAKCSKDFLPTESVMQSLGKNWHPACFSCCKCDGPVGTSGFSVADGKPVCPGCAG